MCHDSVVSLRSTCKLPSWIGDHCCLRILLYASYIISHCDTCNAGSLLCAYNNLTNRATLQCWISHLACCDRCNVWIALYIAFDCVNCIEAFYFNKSCTLPKSNLLHRIINFDVQIYLAPHRSCIILSRSTSVTNSCYPPNNTFLPMSSLLAVAPRLVFLLAFVDAPKLNCLAHFPDQLNNGRTLICLQLLLHYSNCSYTVLSRLTLGCRS